MANPVASPGTVVPSGVNLFPGGAQGIQGLTGRAGPNSVSGDTGSIATIGSDNLISVASLASPTSRGLLPQLANTGQQYLCDTGAWRGVGRYYNADTVNTSSIVITVDSDFQLTNGVIVWFYITAQYSLASPTLNVNSTGAKPLINRAGITLNQYDLVPNKLTGVIYDNNRWRVFSAIQRIYAATNPGNITLECAGYESVGIYVAYNTVTSTIITLSHLHYGVPIMVCWGNSYTAANAAGISATDPMGNAMTCYGVFANTTVGGGLTGLASFNINASSYLMLNGMASGGVVFLK
jgi:hypothetical protein